MSVQCSHYASGGRWLSHISKASAGERVWSVGRHGRPREIKKYRLGRRDVRFDSRSFDHYASSLPAVLPFVWHISVSQLPTSSRQEREIVIRPDTAKHALRIRSAHRQGRQWNMLDTNNRCRRKETLVGAMASLTLGGPMVQL